MSGFLNASEDDDLDFTGGGSSKLANLFGVDVKGSGSGNQSLTYTAPKQPRKESMKDSDKAQSGGSLSCLHAIAVNAYKLVNGQYVNQGKVGAAVLGNHEQSVYNMILYKGKQQTIAMASISINFKLTIQPNNYANFYDSQNQNWSILFDSTEVCCTFAKNLALAVANSCGPNQLKSLVIQDLICGDGNGLENNDSAELNYTGWLLNNNSFGKTFDENKSKDKPFRVKLGKAKVIKGWEDGLIGAKKGCRRLLIIPPHLAYGSKGAGNRVPPNSILIFEIDVNKVKLSKDKEGSSRSETPQPSEIESQVEVKDNSSKPRSSSVKSNENIRARGESITEQLSGSPKTNKAKIISRMAKMGQPMIPLEGAVPAQLSDESSDEAVGNEVIDSTSVNEKPDRSPSPKPVIADKPKPSEPVKSSKEPSSYSSPVHNEPQNASIGMTPQQHQLSVYQSNPFPQQPGMMVGGPMIYPGPGTYSQPSTMPSPYLPMQQMPPTLQNHPANDQHNAVLLSENRNQNTEVRLNLSKLSDKIDMVMTTLNEMKWKSSNIVSTSNIPTLEPSMLSQSINKIVQENTTLRNEIDEKRNKMEMQNEKISELLNRNQRFIEQSNDMFGRKTDSLQTTALESQARILNLEKEKNQLALELSNRMSEFHSLKSELLRKQEMENELKLKLSGHSSSSLKNNEELLQLKQKVSESEHTIENLQQLMKKEKEEKQVEVTKLLNLEETIVDLKNMNSNLEKTIDERKRKISTQRKEFEKQMDELNSSHQDEMNALKVELNESSNSTDPKKSVNEQMLNEKWQLKCDTILADTKSQYDQEMKTLDDQLTELKEKSKLLKSQLQEANKNNSEHETKVSYLQKEVDDLSGWKVKYENLHSNAVKMKKMYEERIEGLENESNQTSGSDQEVKSVMNAVYKNLQDSVDSDESFTGQQLLKTVLNVIRETTMQYLEQKSKTDEVDNSDENDVDGVDEVDEEKTKELESKQELDENLNNRINQEDSSEKEIKSEEEESEQKNPVETVVDDKHNANEITESCEIMSQDDNVVESHNDSQCHGTVPSATIDEKTIKVNEEGADNDSKEINLSLTENSSKIDSVKEIKMSDNDDISLEISTPVEIVDDSVDKGDIPSPSLEYTSKSDQILDKSGESSFKDENPDEKRNVFNDSGLKPPSPPPLWSDDDEDDDAWLS